MARDMIANNRESVPASCKINALVTLGTPHLGYPGGSLDPQLATLIGINPYQANQMSSDFRSQPPPGVLLSSYLADLENKWNQSTLLRPRYWYALSGSLCQQAIRTGDATNTYGCPDYNKTSDGVVCEQSSQYKSGGIVQPDKRRAWDGFAHSPLELMCNPNPGLANIPGSFVATYQGQSPAYLYDPPAVSLLFADMVSYIVSHCCGQ